MGLPKEYVENSIFQRNQTVVTSAPQSAATTAAPEQPAKKEEPKAQEKTSFTVKLVKMDEGAKYKVLKEIRALKPGMNIADVKNDSYSFFLLKII